MLLVEKKTRVLLADDEDTLRAALERALEREGYGVDAQPDGEAAWEAYRRGGHDLAVLDILMPRTDGIELLRRIRGSDPRLPVMFLTSKDEEFDRVLGLELGADDYLCKPFSLRELLARVKALLRRSGGGSTISAAGARLRAAGLELDPERFEARVGSTALRLTLTEFRILEALVRAPGIVRNRDYLVAAAYPEETFLSDRAIDCHIKRIRRKLVEAGAEPELVETVYGLGYRLRESP